MKRGSLFLISNLIVQGLFWVSKTWAEESTPKLDSGDTAWVMVSTALVMLMSLPGLVLFYGGLAKKKDVLNTMGMTFVTYALVSILWIIYGYSLAFNTDLLGIIGSPSKVLLRNITLESLQGTIPEWLFIIFQLTFAGITVALISGAFIERMKFSSWIIFTILWVTLVYVPVAHWVWGGGFLAKLGALDFAGGTVVHINAGIAALMGTFFLGKRKEPVLKPHNLTLVIIGASLLWFGWFGFNAGSALASNPLASIAFLNTNTATALAALVWMFLEWIFQKKPTTLGLASGAVAGLVAITPAAGFVNIGGALIIGIFASLAAYPMVAWVKTRLGYDDALDVFGIHGIAGIVGALLTGILADPEINQLGKGLLYGNPAQLWIQALSVGVTIIYDAIMTILIFLTLKITIGIKVSDEEELLGLDLTQHKEKAYDLD
ncbi:MAG: ammonium transporter [Thermodesulfobacteriaceae bacterium]|nr:ammonium transporter [Thermodesulfobacteriaceae bacterium]MCX8041801.1 ammonium transporter [Thermodesulfobacteriaceae bacterium]MDW8136177.1 ammonium transporter [Thermodesulfobacterium sp.]